MMPFFHRKSELGFAALAILALAISGCAPPGSDSAQESEQTFEVRGAIRAIPPDRETLTIEHEEIPNFMPAMTMPFYLKEPSLADGLVVGDQVAFRFVVSETDSWIDRIRKLDSDEAAAAPAAQTQRQDPMRARIPRLDEGDLVPSFHLVNQDGEAFETAEFLGSAVVVTFIFTRCPVPNFCPLMSSKFKELQRDLRQDDELRNQVHLLSVTIDPEYDTPEVLRNYAGAYTDSHENWTFATGQPDRIDEMTTRFSIFIDPESPEGSIDHALGTALVGPNGRLITIWRGNQWDPADIMEAIANSIGNIE